jgi:dTDP-4-amino-4,6-dideoxygalactose transaminase
MRGEALAKLPTAPSCRRRYEYHRNGRTAFAAFLEQRAGDGGRPVLLPAYVGWSPREGSGVFDPLRAAARNTSFYRVDRDLRVDLDHFAAVLRREAPAGVVLIHYFGYVDPAYAELVRLAREQGAWILEDEAHALLTDLVMGISGRLGDAAILSLHKILPVAEGGVLIRNDARPAESAPTGGQAVPSDHLWDFDLAAIAGRRRNNAIEWTDALRPFQDWLRPLRDACSGGEVPQSLPMQVSGLSRDALYHDLNAKGIGVVSLYHTLIDRLRPEEFPASHELSRMIINFPVHQDITSAAIRAAVPAVSEAIHALRKA